MKPELLSSADRLKNGSIDYVRVLWDYRALFVAGAILFGTSALLPSISVWSTAPKVCNAVALCTNGATPWGVVTSVFLYDSWMNVPAYFAILTAYISFSDRIEPKERRARARFASGAMFLAAITANVIWVLAKPATYSWGPSGVVYALWGILFAFVFFDGMPKQPKSLDPRSWYKDKKERNFAVSNLTMFAVTAAFMVLEPAQFLSAGPNINSFAHGIGFLGGYSLAYAYRRIGRAHSRETGATQNSHEASPENWYAKNHALYRGDDDNDRKKQLMF